MKLSEMKGDSTTKSEPKNIEKQYDELKNCSSDELMNRLFKEVQQQKLNGTFDSIALLNAVEKIKIYLPTQTYENMLKVIESLK